MQYFDICATYAISDLCTKFYGGHLTPWPGLPEPLQSSWLVTNDLTHPGSEPSDVWRRALCNSERLRRSGKIVVFPQFAATEKSGLQCFILGLWHRYNCAEKQRRLLNQCRNIESIKQIILEWEIIMMIINRLEASDNVCIKRAATNE